MALCPCDTATPSCLPCSALLSLLLCCYSNLPTLSTLPCSATHTRLPCSALLSLLLLLDYLALLCSALLSPSQQQQGPSSCWLSRLTLIINFGSGVHDVVPPTVMLRQVRPHADCHAIKQELLSSGISVIDDCPIYQDGDILCRVGSHPSTVEPAPGNIHLRLLSASVITIESRTLNRRLLTAYKLMLTFASFLCWKNS